MAARPFKIVLFSLCLMPTSILAADINTAPSYAKTQWPSWWNGFYYGMNLGGTWLNATSINRSNYDLPSAPINSANWLMSGTAPTGNGAGFIGGGQFGYNFQPNAQSVIGFETDIQGVTGNGGGKNSVSSYSNIPAGIGLSNVGVISSTQASKGLDYLGTVRARAGYLFYPRWLIYVTGGLAYGGISSSISSNQYYTGNLGLASFNGLQSSYLGAFGTRTGWTAGGGLEWLASSQFSIKAEYLYYDLGNQAANRTNYFYSNQSAPIPSSVSQFSTNFNGSVVRAGLNYHINWGDVWR